VKLIACTSFSDAVRSSDFALYRVECSDDSEHDVRGCGRKLERTAYGGAS
jgi:hypothetical protein